MQLVRSVLRTHWHSTYCIRSIHTSQQDATEPTVDTFYVGQRKTEGKYLETRPYRFLLHY